MFQWKNVGTTSTHQNQRKKYKEVGLPVFMLLKFPIFFIGLVRKRFLSDTDSIYTVAVEVDCLQEKNGITDCVLNKHPRNKKYVGIILIHDII